MYIYSKYVLLSFSETLYLSFTGSSCAVSVGIKYTPAMAAGTLG